MSKLRPAVREVQRLAHQYSTAVFSEAKPQRAAILRSAYRIFRARWKYGVGPLYYCLYRFSHIPETMWSNYLTDDPGFKQLLRDMSPDDMHRLAENKALFYQHCVAHHLPTIPILCVVGTSPDQLEPDLPFVGQLDQWLAAMNSAPDHMFVKAIAGTYGEGSFTISRSADGNFEFEGVTGSARELFGYIERKLADEEGWIVQPRLRSHPALRGIVSPNGLATVRVVTAMQAGKARILIAGFKLTVGANITDNFSKGAAGNLLAAVDLETGTLSTAWGSVRADWPQMASFCHHPDSGKTIDGFVLPLWAEVVALALRAQECLPRLASAGWDIAISEQGAVLIEANLTYDLSILQIAHQRGLKNEILSALSEIPTTASKKRAYQQTV